ncbi:MAG: GNAT family N-acetyltransferase [Chitinophagaceae bacterium]
MEINWVLKKFDELSPGELYAVMQLRNAVFVVEQNCVYQDADNKDQTAYHFLGWFEDELVAYTRILPPGLSYTEPSIGRVVTAPGARRSGLGRKLMELSIEQLYKLYGKTAIRIGAQVYLLNFYSSLGFRQTGDLYLEDGIEHAEMVKS